jgi:hypothetical protein
MSMTIISSCISTLKVVCTYHSATILSLDTLTNMFHTLTHDRFLLVVTFVYFIDKYYCTPWYVHNT